MHGHDVLLQVRYLLLLRGHQVLVRLVLVVDLLSVVLVDGCLRVAELSGLLLLLLLEGLVARRILQHALRVLVTPGLHLLVVFLLQVLQLPLEVLHDLVLARLQVLGPAADLELLGRELLV